MKWDQPDSKKITLDFTFDGPPEPEPDTNEQTSIELKSSKLDDGNFRIEVQVFQFGRPAFQFDGILTKENVQQFIEAIAPE